MSSKPPTSKSFLGSDVRSEKKIIGAESLNPEQKVFTESYIESSASPGIFVGALAGRASWDVRPLLLVEGSLLLLRMTPPRHIVDGGRLNLFAEWADGVKSAELQSPGLEFGEKQGRWWVTRKFYSETLTEIAAGQHPQEQHPAEFSPELISKSLLYQVQLLHESGLVHGHISNSNLAVESGSIVLFDHMFAAINREQMPEGTFAPEIARGALPSMKGDIYSLGQLLNSWLSSDEFPDLQVLTKKMLSPDPGVRPQISEVLRHLWPDEYRPRKVYRDSRILSRENLKTGRLVSLHDSEPSQVQNPPAVINKEENTPALSSGGSKMPAVVDEKPVPDKGRSGVRYLPIFIVTLVVSAAIFALYHYELPEWSAVDDSPYELYWNSNQPSLMEHVAVAAATSNRKAQLVISGSILSGTEHPNVHEKIISVALNEKWEKDLSTRDREMVFRLSLSRLLPDDLKDVQSLSEAHSGVLLAIVGSSSIESDWPELARIGLEKFSRLPDPFGLSFAELMNQGTTNLGAVESRALIQILTGNLSVRAIEAFIESNADEELATRRLRLLVSLFRQMPSLQEFFEESSDQFSGLLSERLSWFSAAGLGGWDTANVSLVDKLFLSAGVPPGLDLKFEQLADLLSFPEKTIREHALAELLREFLPQHVLGLLEVMAKSDSGLSRYQTVTLAFALGLEPEQAYPFFADWFTSDPPPATVVDLLASQGTAYQRATKGQDGFSLEAARYLKVKDWDADVEVLKKLAEHSEPLVRALAYSKLDANRVEDANILRRRLELETSEILKEDLARKLR